MENAVCMYPLDLRTYHGQKKTLNIESHLHRAEAENGESPYTNYGTFSRFKFTYIDKSGPKSIFVDANIRPDDIPDIVERAKFANRLVYEQESKRMGTSSNENDDSKNDSQKNSPAYTVRFTSGTLKGKTPAEVISENPETGKDILNKQYLFLKSNLEKFPNNKKQMDAIVEAGKLLQTGDLKEVESVCTSFSILKPEMHPLKSRPQKNGLTFVYEIGISCCPTNNYPFEVTIENYYAPVIEKENKTLNVRKKDAQDIIVKTFKMNTHDFNDMIHALQTNMRQFEDVIAKTQFNEAYKYDAINRENARKMASGE